jgi:CheY-like chemotaxis protein
MDRFRPLDGLHVVVVDDDADGRDMMTLALTKQGAHVTAADSAAEVRTILRYLRPDVLICDLAMPRESGVTLIQWVRRLPLDGGRTVRALALTAFSQRYGRARAFTAGFDEYATKPVDPWELCRIVAKVAGRTPPPGPSPEAIRSDSESPGPASGGG